MIGRLRESVLERRRRRNSIPDTPRQHPVEHDEIGPFLLDDDQGLLAGLCVRHAKALRLEVVAKHLRKRRFMLDNQNLGVHSDNTDSFRVLPLSGSRVEGRVGLVVLGAVIRNVEAA